MPDTPPESEGRLDRLIGLATELNTEIEDLTRDSGKQFVSLAKTARTNRTLIVVTIFSLLIDLAITGVLAVIGTGMQHNTDRIDALTQRLDEAQTVQRQKALCPLYGVMMDSKSAQGRAVAPDPKKYDNAFKVIHDGYVVLECDKYLKTGDQ